MIKLIRFTNQIIVIHSDFIYKSTYIIVDLSHRAK